MDEFLVSHADDAAVYFDIADGAVGPGVTRILDAEDGPCSEGLLGRFVGISVIATQLSADEAEELIQEAREAVAEGQDPEEVCCDYFGLEPDYIWELL